MERGKTGHLAFPCSALPAPCFFVPCALCLVPSILLFLSFPPVNAWPLAWVALIPLFFLLDRIKTHRAAFGWSYLTGFIFFLLVLQWIHFVTLPGLVLLASYLALYFGVFGLFFQWTKRWSWAIRLILVPAGWTVLEFLRGIMLSGFNWGSLGHTQALFTGLIALSSVTGVAGVSFSVVVGNLCIKEFGCAILERRLTSRQKWLAIVLLGLLAMCALMTWRRSEALPANVGIKSVKVALIQPNVSLAQAWDPGARAEVVNKLLGLSRQALTEKPELIIWPETSFPHFIWDQPILWESVQRFAREHQVSLLVGAVTRTGENYFNSALLLGPDGQIVKVHGKRHLVLFGEYIPFRKELPFLADLVPIDDFTSGTEETVFELPGGVRFSVLVCFEDTLPYLTRRYAQKGADFFVNMTNDAWFGDSGQTRMHLDNAAFRTVENARPLVRATNTGESCAVSCTGRIIDCVQDQKGRRVLIEGVSVVSIPILSVMTFYTKYGDIFTGICFIAILGAGIILRRRAI